MLKYQIVIEPLPDEEGGGYVAIFPDLLGCMSDGETPEEALKNALDAFEEWMVTAREREGFVVPEPGHAGRIARAKEQRLRDDINTLKTGYQDLGGKIGEIEAKVEDIQEQIEAHSALVRFSEIAGFAPNGIPEGNDEPKRRPRI